MLASMGGMSHGVATMSAGTQQGAQTGFTPGWFRGNTVQFFYHTNNFFCRTPVADGQPVGSTTLCEGDPTARSIRAQGGAKPTLFIMTAMGFRPDSSTLHCPIVGQCTVQKDARSMPGPRPLRYPRGRVAHNGDSDSYSTEAVKNGAVVGFCDPLSGSTVTATMTPLLAETGMSTLPLPLESVLNVGSGLGGAPATMTQA